MNSPTEPNGMHTVNVEQQHQQQHQQQQRLQISLSYNVLPGVVAVTKGDGGTPGGTTDDIPGRLTVRRSRKEGLHLGYRRVGAAVVSPPPTGSRRPPADRRYHGSHIPYRRALVRLPRRLLPTRFHVCGENHPDSGRDIVMNDPPSRVGIFGISEHAGGDFPRRARRPILSEGATAGGDPPTAATREPEGQM